MNRLVLSLFITAVVGRAIPACRETSSAQARPAGAPPVLAAASEDRPTAPTPSATTSAKPSAEPSSAGSEPDAEPAVAGSAPKPPPRLSGVIVRASDYRKSCSTHSECVMIAEGDVCSPCHCATGAINRADLPKYESFRRKHLPSCPKNLKCLGDCDDHDGDPGLCIDHVCTVGR
jgi:hypothetical protein